MKQKLTSVTVTLWVNRAIGAILIALLFCLPALLRWYGKFRALTDGERIAITAAFYCCAVFTFWALWNLDVLLRNIREGKVFVRENVSRIRAVDWCCACVSLVCFPAAIVYLPLIFMAVIMAFLCLVVSVVCQVMKAAVDIREENDLTI